MSDTTPFDDTPLLDPLTIHLDAAAEQMRRANHLTYIPREVTDLSTALAALYALFSRFDQLAGYLQQTVAQADPIDFRHDHHGDVALSLALVGDSLDQARDHAARTARALTTGWAQLSHLALDIPDLACPECGEPAYRGIPIDLTTGQRTAGVRPRYRHADGTQRCPVVGDTGYEPAAPVRPEVADPCPSRSCIDPQ